MSYVTLRRHETGTDLFPIDGGVTAQIEDVVDSVVLTGYLKFIEDLDDMAYDEAENHCRYGISFGLSCQCIAIALTSCCQRETGVGGARIGEISQIEREARGEEASSQLYT